VADEEKAPAEAPGVDTRGELRLTLDADYGLRPDFAAIAAIERQVRPLRALVAAADSMDLSIEEMAVCVAELWRGYGRAHPDDEMIETYRNAKPSRIAELIFEQGAPMVSTRLTVIFAAALTGGYTASGEAKAPAMRKRTRAGA
jgi:hypothetical protein